MPDGLQVPAWGGRDAERGRGGPGQHGTGQEVQGFVMAPLRPEARAQVVGDLASTAGLGERGVEGVLVHQGRHAGEEVSR